MCGDLDTARERTARSDRIVIRGRITVANSGEISSMLANALRNRPANLTVDLSEVPYIDTSGLATLLEAAGKARKQGTRLVLSSVQEQARYLFKITQLDRLIDLEGQEPGK